jgi:ribonuclease-3
MENVPDLNEIEKSILEDAIKKLHLPEGINKYLLFTAFSHSSYVFEKDNKDRMLQSNERLEFLGDSILELVISEFLYKSFDLSEGDMSKIRATVASEFILAEIAAVLKLNDFLFLGVGEDKHGGREKHSILADATESYFASLYLSYGYDYTKKYILEKLDPYLKKAIAGDLFLDHKTKLQEITQEKFKVLPEYEIVKAKGPSHIRYYKIAVKINNEIYGIGEGNSKKNAQQLAAKYACKKLEEDKND